MTKKEKYQWAIHVNSLSRDDLRKLIEALEGTIALNIDVFRNKAIVEFAKNRLNSRVEGI